MITDFKTFKFVDGRTGEFCYDGPVDVERTIEFILQAQAAAAAAAEARLAQDKVRWAKADEEMAAIREILAQTAQVQRMQGEHLVRMDRSMEELAAAQKVTEVKLQELAATQRITEQKLQGLIEALRRGSNGHLN